MQDDLKIIIVDDLLADNAPVMVSLKENYNNVILFKDSKKGLEYIMGHLSEKMIVILDLDFGNMPIQGINIFEEIRQKTSLVYIMIRTANLGINQISQADLKNLVNNNTLAILDKMDSPKKVLEYVAKAAHQLETRIDSVIERWITRHSDDEREEPYMATRSGKRYSLNDMLQEIRHQTEFGKDMEKKILYLTIDLLTREKEAIND